MDGAGGNSDGAGFDPCDCINMIQMNHQRAMERLTAMLRNAQTTCTNNECFPSQLPGGQNTGGTGDTNMSQTYFMIALWLAIAFLLFMFRPRTIRNNRNQQGKPHYQGPSPDQQDPPGPEVQ